MKSFNQAGQEVWVRNKLGNKTNGFFVDIGAYDGVESSNSYYLDKELYWGGICIESNIDYFRLLQSSRGGSENVKLVNKAVTNFSGVCAFNGINVSVADPNRINSNRNVVECDTLNNILLQNNCPRDIDYISMDIEGWEVTALESLDFNYFNVTLFTIEHNSYLTGPKNKDKIKDLMLRNGYAIDREDVLAPEGPYEDWYVKII